uniref:ABC1 domain-containing protein n=1 Tax=Steinernema glaseri TaxID=37863 RepID=A0A1I7YSY9_9BILA
MNVLLQPHPSDRHDEMLITWMYMKYVKYTNVYKATTLDRRKVTVKIQYPGVAEGIDSDIDNLVTILNVGHLFPKGMFLKYLLW